MGKSRTTTTALATTVAGLALVAAGCGSSPRAASGKTPPRDGAAAAFRFATCMRDHGVTNFPDPQVSSADGHQSIKLMVPASAARSPRFKSAQNACRGILPIPQNANQAAAQQQARKRDLLAFARCLRDHGVSGFPDPTSQGQLTLQMISAAGVDIHTHAVLTAAEACVGVTHGAITRAQVAQAINGAG
jgi:hypothetical protein